MQREGIMPLDRRRRAIRFVEELAEGLFKEKHGVMISARDQKSHFKRSIYSLTRGKLRTELCKYSPLYCKRFKRCIRNLKQRLAASQETNIGHNDGPAAQNSEDAPTGPADQQSSGMEDGKQGQGKASGMIPLLPVQPKERPCSSKEIKKVTQVASDDQFNRACSRKELSVSRHPPQAFHPRKKPDSTKLKDTCVRNSKNVNELSRELTVLYHQCDNASLTKRMNHAVRLFSLEVAATVKSKNATRASDVQSRLHSVMLYFHFKCDILHTDKKQIPLCKDFAYKGLMASMLSLYSSLDMLITRSDSGRSPRLAQHTLFKACLLLDNKELLMDVILQLSVKPEPIDAPYLYPTLMHVLKHPPYPFTPPSYIKHILVCRLARYILPQNQYPELTEQLKSSLSLLPPHGLTTWLADLCPHLTSELSSYAHDHRMTSYFLQIASYDLCNKLQQTLYRRPGSVGLGRGVDDVSGSADFSGAIDTDGDPAAILEPHEVDVGEVSGNHSGESNLCSVHQNDSTDSSKSTERSIYEICKDVIEDNVQSKIPMSLNEPGQTDTISDISDVRKKARKNSKTKAKTVKALPQAGDEGERLEEVLVLSQENESTDKGVKGTTSHVPVVSKKVGKKSKKKDKKKRIKGSSLDTSDVSKKADRKSKKKAKAVRTLPQASNERKRGEEVLVIVQENGSDEKLFEGTSSDEPVVSKKTDRKSKKKSKKKSKTLPRAGKLEESAEEVLVTVQENGSEEKQLECRGMDTSTDPSLIKRCEQDLLRVDINPIPPSLNKNEKKQRADCHTSANKNSECPIINEPAEDCVVVSDSCSEETASVDIIYDTDTEHSDHLQQKMALRKARHFKNLLPSADSSKSVTGSNSSCVMTRSRYRKSMSDASTVQSSREKPQGKHESTARRTRGLRAVSPVFEGIKLRLVHIDRNRGSVGVAEEVETGKEQSPVLKEATRMRRSPNRLDPLKKWDSKKYLMREEVIETPESWVSLDSAKGGLNTSIEAHVDSSPRRPPRAVNHRKKSEITSSPKKLMGEHIVDCQPSVMSVDSAQNGLYASAGAVSRPRRSPRKHNYQDESEHVVKDDLSADRHKSVISSPAKGVQRTDAEDMTCLRRSPRKGNPKNNLESMIEEFMSDQSVDPYEFIDSSHSAVDYSKKSPTFASSLHRSRRGNLKDKLQSSADQEFPESRSSYREKIRQPGRNVAQGCHSFKRDVDKGVTTRQQGQIVSTKNDSSFVGLQGQTASSGKCPPSSESSLSQFRSLRKRSFSDSLVEQSSSSSKVFASMSGFSAEHAVLRSRVSLKQIGVVPPYAQVFDPRVPQGEPSYRWKTSLGVRSLGSRTTDGKGSPRRLRVKTSTDGSNSGSKTTDGKGHPQRSEVKTSLDGSSSGNTKDSKDIPQRSGVPISSTGESSSRRTSDTKDSPRSSKVNLRQGFGLRSSPRVRLIRKALKFE